jgi:putative exporter of polyketide antibiotics
VPQGNNKKAVWSLVLGILGIVCCGFFTGIPALILGRSAQQEIAASGGAQTGSGMAKAGFILGIISIVLGIIGVILSLTGVINYNFSAGSTSP